MDTQIYSFIFNIVSGLVTNGIQGIYNYIAKETLQEHIANVIERTQKAYEEEFKCKAGSLFAWEKNIEYFGKWLRDGFMPRAEIVLPCPYDANQNLRVTKKELQYIYEQMSRLVKEDTELSRLHAFTTQDEIYRLLAEKDKDGINPDYYNYVRSYGDLLFLHKADGKRAITLKDTYVMPEYELARQSSIQGLEDSKNIIELLIKFANDHENRVMIIEGDAGVGKSSLVAHLCFNNEKCIEKTGKGIFGSADIYCVRLRNLTMSKGFIEVPVNHIIESLGFQTDSEYEILSKQAVVLLDGFDELCMIDGMNDYAEYVLAEIIRGFSDYHIIITTRPKFLDISKLREQGVYTGVGYVILKHFNVSKRNEWIEKYRAVCEEDEYCQLEKISKIDDDASEGICDTPLALYMLAAGKITDEAWENPWVLYHQIFRIELSSTEYNKLFSKKLFAHSISRYNDILYQVSAEIAYKMYMTANKKLYVTKGDIEEIISYLKLDQGQTGSLIKRCYALCNYWKNDGKSGIAEFYHNNIRDFFLCEKIFIELERIYHYFSEECMADAKKCDDAVEKFISSFGSLFVYSDFNDKVSEFVYYRSLYKMKYKREENFLQLELKYQFLAYFFEKMFVHGAIHDYIYDGRRNLFQENINVLKCVVQIYRHIYEPYVISGKKRMEWFVNITSELSEMDVLPYLFKAVFIRTPLTISSDYSIPIAGYANFNIYDMKKADLRYGMFNHSNFTGCNFSGTILVSTDFSYSNLKKCNFENADFRHSSLLGADIKECKFENCNLAGTTLPDGFCSDEEDVQLEHIRKFV